MSHDLPDCLRGQGHRHANHQARMCGHDKKKQGLELKSRKKWVTQLTRTSALVGRPCERDRVKAGQTFAVGAVSFEVDVRWKRCYDRLQGKVPIIDHGLEI